MRVTADEISLRPEMAADYRAVEELTREAFWNLHVPGCDEHYLVHLLHDSPAFIPELAMVAEAAGRVVGVILYTRAVIHGDSGEDIPVLCFGPLAVHPDWQRRGIGRQLIGHTVDLARSMGERAILIYGDPAYYSRFGFEPAEWYGIASAEDEYSPALQAYELYPGSLGGCSGRFAEDAVFAVDAAAAAAFDRGFPPLEYRNDLPSQARFRELSSQRRRRGGGVD